MAISSKEQNRTTGSGTRRLVRDRYKKMEGANKA